MQHILQPLSLRLLFSNVFDRIITKEDDQTDTLPATITSQEVFDIVVHKYVDKLYRYINYNFGLQKSATDDIIQEIFLALPKKLKRFNVSQKLDPRLFRVAHNTALDHIKKHKRRSDKELEIDMIATEDFLYQASSEEKELPQTLTQAYHE